MRHSSPPISQRIQSGISMIELLVAMILVIVILAGLISMFSSNKIAYTSQESISRIQEAYRFASEIIQKEVRSAGYYGCNRESSIVDTLSSLPFEADHTKPIEGFNATDATTWDRAITPTSLTIGTTTGDIVRGGTDILVVRRVSDTQHALNAAMATTSASPQIAANISPVALSVDDVAIISDCKRSAIFQVTGFTIASGIIAHSTTGGSIGNSTAQLLTSAPAFDLDADVMRFNTTVFFIGTSTNGTPSLKRKVNSAPSEIIIDGVENMQILYGLDTDADGIANRYVNASNITAVEWANVTSARISLLMLAPENSLPENDAETYVLLDESIADTGTTITHAGDLRFRQSVNMTVDIRNL
ncbi:MAG: PilW family protein [Gammaproteobacteria bacterium]|nr:PilW family protein [Gammaproteobacteria bacterium]